MHVAGVLSARPSRRSLSAWRLAPPLQPTEERSLLRTPIHLPVSRDSLPVQSTLTPSTLTPSSIPCLEHSLLAGTRPTPHITGQLPYHTQAPAAAVPSPPPLPSLPVPTQSLEPLHLFNHSLPVSRLPSQPAFPSCMSILTYSIALIERCPWVPSRPVYQLNHCTLKPLHLFILSQSPQSLPVQSTLASYLPAWSTLTLSTLTQAPAAAQSFTHSYPQFCLTSVALAPRTCLSSLTYSMLELIERCSIECPWVRPSPHAQPRRCARFSAPRFFLSLSRLPSRPDYLGPFPFPPTLQSLSPHHRFVLSLPTPFPTSVSCLLEALSTCWSRPT